MMSIHDLKEDFLASHAGNPLENVFNFEFVCMDARKKQPISYLLLFLVMVGLGNALLCVYLFLVRSVSIQPFKILELVRFI